MNADSLRDSDALVFPDYSGGCIANLMASLAAGLGARAAAACVPCPALPPAEVAAARQTLLWVIDGLGYRQLLRHCPGGALAAALRGPLTSVFPSTTAAAIPCFLTGEPPAGHGITGWFMWLRELDRVMTVLPGRPRGGGPDYAQAGIDVAALYATRPFTSRLAVDSVMVSPAQIARSPFNLAHLGRSGLVSYRGLDDLVARLLACCAAPLAAGQGRYLYAYWPELDRVGHEQGADSPAYAAHLLQLDRAFARLQTGLRGLGVTLVVTADHGQLDGEAVAGLDLNRPGHPLAGLLRRPLCGERRAAFAYLRPGAGADLEALLAGELADALLGLPAQAVLEAGWFGPGARHPELAQRIGDWVLLPRGARMFTQWLPGERPYRQVGVHGGLSEAEMLVPLVVDAC